MKVTFRCALSGVICGRSAHTFLVSGLLVATLLLALPQMVLAQTTHTVCKAAEPGCDYTSPEAAVNDPAVVAGDTIDITTDTYVLSTTLLVDRSMTIRANDSVFDATGRRAIDVSGAATNLSLTNVTIRNGLADASGGGALRVSDGGVVTVINGTFENNQADFGGAIHNIGSIVNMDVAVFSGNRATAGDGGAVLIDSGGSTTLERTTIDGNQASLAGGGLAVADTDSQLNLIASTVSNNVVVTASLDQSNETATTTTTSCFNFEAATQGQTFQPTTEVLTAFEFEVRLGGDVSFHPAPGAVLQGRVRLGGQGGSVIATATTVWPAGLSGGASLFLRYELDVPVSITPGVTHAIEIDTTGAQSFSIYTTSSDPYPDGSVYSSCGGPAPTDDYDFRTFGGAPGDGGGIYASAGGQAGLFNSTVSGNVGDGATAAPDSIVSTLFSTITNNSGNGLTAWSDEVDGLVFITASIVAGNGIDDCNGSTTSSGYNLIGDDTNCSVTPTIGDLVGNSDLPINPLLGPLQDNGGWTETHAIDFGSPALDAAGADIPGLPCADAANDQRGVGRPDGAACDIGSVELFVPVVPGPLQLLIDAATAAEETLIIVPDGTYTELITIGNGQTLQGSGPDNVVINTSDIVGSAITAAGDFNLRGIRVTGGNSPGNGGGIVANIVGTDITLNNVVFDNNDASFDGGAIYLSDGTLTVINATFTSNGAGRDGGAIAGGADVSITASLFEGNTATVRGGSVFNDGNLSLRDTTIDSSDAGIGGGIFTNDIGDRLDVSSSTFSNNTANAPAGTAGGAIGGAGSMEILNSTFSGNSATDGNGGGIGLTAGNANLNNVTLAFNAAPTGFGGPFYAETGALISLRNSLLSGNTGGDTDCSSVVSLGYNLFQLAPCPTVASDITAEPLIGILDSNGGLTETHALQALSPAVDAADPGQPAIELASALSDARLSFNGVAVESGGNLVPVSGAWGQGSIFASAPDEGPFDLTGSFSTQFSFQITDPVACCGEPSGDGFTFAIAANPTVLGEVGGRLGVATTPGPLGTVSVEFDTWANGGDISTNAIGINVGGFVISDSVVSAAQAAIPGEFDDGNVWTAWIDYHADINRLEVRVAADGIRPDLPQLSHVVDIAAEVGATGYYGFTGGTGLAHATHTVTAWEFFITSCPAFDQRGVSRPKDLACDIGAYETQVSLELGSVVLSTLTLGQGLDDGTSYPGVVDVPIIEIPIEKLTGDTFNAPESAPLGSFPLGSFPIGSFDLKNVPMGSFPLGSFPIGSFPIGSFPLGSFPIGSFPLSSIPLLSTGGWTEVLNGIPELAGAPLQTVTLEQLLTHSSFPDSVDGIELRHLSIQGSPLASFSLQGLSLGDTTVDELDQWTVNAGEAGTVCTTLAAGEPAFTDCGTDDTLLSLEFKGAPVSALSLSSLPLGSFPIGSFPLGSFPIGSFPLGSFPLGSFPIGSFRLVRSRLVHSRWGHFPWAHSH